MRVDQHYLVRGNPSLMAQVKKDPDFWSLARPLLLSSPERGLMRRPPPPPGDDGYLLRAKLFTLMFLMNEYGGLDKIGAFLRSGTLSGSFFDRWWEITPIEESAAEVPALGEKCEKYKAPAGLARGSVPPTGSLLVDDWLERVVQFEHPTEHGQ